MYNISPCFPFACNIALGWRFGWRWVEERRGAVKYAEISQLARNALDLFCSKKYHCIITELAQTVIFTMHMAFSALLNLVKCKVCLLPLVHTFYCSLGWISINNWEQDQRPIFKRLTVRKCSCSQKRWLRTLKDRVWSERNVHGICKGCFKIHNVLVAFLIPKELNLRAGWTLRGFQALSTLPNHTIRAYQDNWEALRSVFKLIQHLSE